MAKYPIKQSLRNIADIISKQIGQIDGDLKTKSQAYNNLKGNLQNLEKKKTYVVNYNESDSTHAYPNHNLYIVLYTQWQFADTQSGGFGQEGALHTGFGVLDHAAGHCAKVCL